MAYVQAEWPRERDRGKEKESEKISFSLLSY
jgi:hypothetical protein